MKLTSALFEAYLKCPTKCYLCSTDQVGSGNAYAEWVREQNDNYQKEGVQRLVAATGEGVAASTPGAANLKTAPWRLAVDLPVETETMASRLHAVERVPSQGRGKPAQFIPVRFVFFNKLTKDDRLLVAFDALVLSEVLGREVTVGKIILGDDQNVLKVKVASLLETVRKLTAKMSAMLAAGSPPDLILNRHCGECEFRDGCRQKAVEKDDLSLLGGMTEKERKKFHSKGIFTVTQLSYTFRPRRRPKRLRDKREKYHHALKALAIREKKIHIVGNPELKIDGTPVYLDVEGLPDRDFYYLIGLRIGNGESANQHSLWADTVQEEEEIWREFLTILEALQNPVLVHYGSYETIFLKRMADRYGQPTEASAIGRTLRHSVNLLSSIYAQMYFPTCTNGLKDLAGFLGFTWSVPNPSGLDAVRWRYCYEQYRNESSRERLLVYNSDDCKAVQIVANALLRQGRSDEPASADGCLFDTVKVDSLKVLETMWPRFKSPFSEFEQINAAARWDYQRDRIYARSSKRIRLVSARRSLGKKRVGRSASVVSVPEITCCPVCKRFAPRRLSYEERLLFDIQFNKCGLRRKTSEYHYAVYWCSNCELRLGVPSEFWPKSKYGRGLVAYLLYHIVEQCIPMGVVGECLNRLLGFNLTQPVIHNLKRSAAKNYKDVQESILHRLANGHLLHVDETRVSVKGKTGCVWVMADLHEVAYVYTNTRESDFIRGLLKDFSGVLISDFFAGYDSLPCRQQKCLIHLIRDLNAEVLAQPYDEELKTMVRGFAQLLNPMIEAVDRYGLKKHFLRKYHRSIERFFRQIDKTTCQSEAAAKCKQRFQKNRDRLFTFIDYDGVPWNNNNAEHAIKAFAHLREVIQGTCTATAIEEYLVLLSVCQTCKYMGVDFLDFLRSGEKDIHAFAESRFGRRRRQQVIQPKAVPADEGKQN